MKITLGVILRELSVLCHHYVNVPTVLCNYIPSLMARLTAIAMVSLLTTFKYFRVFISFSFLF